MIIYYVCPTEKCLKWVGFSLRNYYLSIFLLQWQCFLCGTMSDISYKGEMTSFRDVMYQPDCQPLVFKGAIESWPARTWNVKHLANILKDRQLQCKIAPTDFNS